MRMTNAEWLAYETRRCKTLVNSDGVEDEIELHAEIMRWCNAQWPRWKYIHSRTDARSTIAVGAPDFVVFAPQGRVFCFECKNARGKLTREQLAWQKELEMLGHRVQVIRSFSQFLDWVKQ